MTRRIAIKTKSAVKFYELSRLDRPLTIVERRLYRTDEKLMVSNKSNHDEFVLYDLEGLYPYCVPALENPSPDDTMAYIDVTRGNKNNVNKVGSGLSRTIRKNLVPILIVCVIGYWILTKYVIP